MILDILTFLGYAFGVWAIAFMIYVGIDRARYRNERTATVMFDYVIVREEDNTHTFLKNRYIGINYSGLTEYQLNEKLNDIAIGIIHESVTN